jgi:uncharacterized protein YqjF (DUF2071 family)
VLDLSEYERLRQPPLQPAVMYQRWRSLVFLHFSCDPQEIQALLPSGLTVDTYDERAWVGLVPFRMEGIRPRYLTGVPGATAFPETNVRTYVHRGGREPGVWFFSLDAASPLACRVARGLWKLPYHEAAMNVVEDGTARTYECRRLGMEASSFVSAQIGDGLPDAVPGSLEYFLIERYLLYASRNGRLMKGRVHHPPYPLRQAQTIEVRDDLVRAAGVRPRPFHHVLYSPGVDVRVYPLQAA